MDKSKGKSKHYRKDENMMALNRQNREPIPEGTCQNTKFVPAKNEDVSNAIDDFDKKHKKLMEMLAKN